MDDKEYIKQLESTIDELVLVLSTVKKQKTIGWIRYLINDYFNRKVQQLKGDK